MNIERILALADKIEKLEHVLDLDAPESTANYFNMDMCFYDCGAPACIGGHIVYIENGGALVPDHAISMNAVTQTGMAYLDIPWHDAKELFQPIFGSYARVTPQIAADTLRNLASTGRVRWPDHLYLGIYDE